VIQSVVRGSNNENRKKVGHRRDKVGFGARDRNSREKKREKGNHESSTPPRHRRNRGAIPILDFIELDWKGG